MKKGNGLISIDDLKSYSSKYRDPIIGSFFENELIGYNPDEFYESEVLKQRKTKKGGLEYLVHYIGYPHSMDQWVKASDMKDV